ncbi:MAG: glucosaminidase domain-containing protein [Muribaculaceae bacterium]
MTKLHLLILFICISFNCNAQQLAASYLNYIDIYKNIAVLHQQEYGIPASITLAQGLLESGAGASILASEGNNHFGIKCHKDWTGEGIYHDDDEAQECFRKYDNASQSYEDHAKFLKKMRYKPLFELSITDYKSWAKTLKACGYATDPAYPDKLIDIIERYELYNYDSNQPIIASRKELKGDESIEHATDIAILDELSMTHNIRRKWGLYYITAHNNDSLENIAKEFGIKVKKLRGFNDISDKKAPIEPGAILYLQEKRECASQGNDSYIVKDGDSIHSIAQKFGIKCSSLCKLNDIDKDATISAGETLKLR